MSYILDALRRADAERQRGAVPGLHVPAAAGVRIEPAAEPGASARRLGLLAAVLVLLGLAGAAGWLLRPAAAPVAPVAPLAVLAVPAPTVEGAPQQANPAPASGLGPIAAPPLPPARPGAAVPVPAPGLPLPLPAAALAAAASASTAASNAGPAATPTAALPAERPSAPAQPATAAARARLPSLAELPEAQQREIGPLQVGGAMHAEQAALRIVILNGQVFHEGDKLGPELAVQQIRLKSVVLSLRGQRFELPL